MTWFDELDEQTQRQWRSRLEKGRLDLSASVEQTLKEGAAEEVWEDEDEEEGGVQVVDEHAGEVRRGTAVIPPRLSLQTKPMYAVAAASNQTPGPAPAVESGEAQEHSQEKQHSGVFSRLAQRITMSLAAITLPFQAQGPLPQPSAQEVHVPMPGIFPPTNLSMQTVTTVRVEHSETTTTIIEASPMRHAVPPAGLSLVPPVPQLPWPGQVVQGEGKSRPAGYPTKVHLEAAPKGVSLHSTASTSRKDGEVGYPVHDSTEPLALRNTLSVPRSAPPTLELPTVNATSDEEAREATGADKSAMRTINRAPTGDVGMVAGADQAAVRTVVERGFSGTSSMGEAVYEMTTSGRLPSVHVVDRRSNEVASKLASWAIFGSGSFDGGQGDVAIDSPHVTGSSVVTVMLASDPGPVVVQYISLQPGIGFTVHLSAPTKVKTLFNYVVLGPQGES